MNFNDNPYVTRMGGSFCGFDANVGDILAYDACIALSESVLGLDTCISIPVHAPAHFVGGGTKPLSKIKIPHY